MTHCRECGAELPQDARFCPKCGARVARTSEARQQEHRVFKVSARPKLTVVNHAPGNVDVKTATDGEIVIDLDLREPEDIDWRISQEDNNVTVTCRAKVHFMNWPRYFASGGPRADVTISLPIEADLDVDAHLDQVRVKGLKGSINVDSSVAQVDVESCEGTIRVTGKTGYIDLHDVSGTIDVDSTTGPIDLQNANGTVTVRNTTGPIRFGGSLSTGENRLRTTTGSIEVLLQGKLDLTVEAQSRLGRVTCSPELTNAHHDRGYYTGQIGNGTGRLIVETETGSITIQH